MGAYIIRRLLIGLVVLFFVTVMLFILMNLMPGDPITAYIPPEVLAQAGPEYIEIRREQLGLNKPVVVRYFIWLNELVHGNMGYSVQNGEPVLSRIKERIGATFELTGTALLLAILIGIPIGIISAVKQYSIIDSLVTLFSFTGVSIPVFFLGLGLIYVFSLRLNLLPTGGLATIGAPPSLLDKLSHLIMPAFVLSVANLAQFARYTRSSILDELGQDYVRTARAKGVKELRVLFYHILRNGMIPLITVIALQIPLLFGGAVITEQVFSWPGMGRLALEAIMQRDYPLLMGITTVIAILVLIANLLADILYAVVDPRIRYQ